MNKIMQDKLEKFFSPYLSLTQGRNGLWAPTTLADGQRFMELGMLGIYRTEEIDSVLVTISEKGYSLETIPREQ